MRRPPALLFGVPIADVTMDETVTTIGELVGNGRRTGRTHQIATINVDFLVNALDDPGVLSILQRATLCLADGMPIVWAAQLFGTPLRERVAGSDLVPRLVDESQRTGWHVHIFGSTPEVADASTRLLRERYPEARFSIDPGPIIPDVRSVPPAVIDSIRSIDADIVCIALGNPKQEHFIAGYAERIGAPVMIGVGGSLDMLVGKRRRAPRWVQRVGLEWVVRAAQEPRRLGSRYARDIRVFLPRLWREWRATRQRGAASGLRLRIGDSAVTAELDGETVPDARQWSAAAARVLDDSDLIVRFGGGGAPPGTLRHDAVAQVVGLVSMARRLGLGSVHSDRPRSAGHRVSLQRFGVTPEQLGLDGPWETEHLP